MVDGGVDILLVEIIFDILNVKVVFFVIDMLMEEWGLDFLIMVLGMIIDVFGRILFG